MTAVDTQMQARQGGQWARYRQRYLVYLCASSGDVFALQPRAR